VRAELAALARRWPLPPCTRGFRGEVRPYRGGSYSFGHYTWDARARTVAVTELPLGVATARYLEALTGPGRQGRPNPRAELVESAHDASSVDEVALTVVLREGAFERICAEYGDAEIDPLEDALLLRAPLHARLNYYAGGAVVELGGDYLAALLLWAPLRRDLYAARLERSREVTALRILEESEALRFIGVAASLDLARVADEAAAAAALRALGFAPLDRALLRRPEYTPAAELRALVTAGPGASYAYLLDLRERDLVAAATARRAEALAALRADLDRVTAQLAERPVPGASVWRAEIAQFVATAERGVATRWKFE
jgi:hypothetical protein